MSWIHSWETWVCIWVCHCLFSSAAYYIIGPGIIQYHHRPGFLCRTAGPCVQSRWRSLYTRCTPVISFQQDSFRKLHSELRLLMWLPVHEYLSWTMNSIWWPDILYKILDFAPDTWHLKCIYWKHVYIHMFGSCLLRIVYMHRNSATIHEYRSRICSY